jgi:signal peptidase II
MLFYLVILSTIILDAITKYFASIFLQEKINVLWDFFYLEYTLNDWIAFWINIPFLKIITIILIFWIFYYYISTRQKTKDKKQRLIDWSFWLILGWAIWNGIERIFFGEVTDFIGVKYFAVFNLADSFIFIWVLLYLIYLLVNEKWQ